MSEVYPPSPLAPWQRPNQSEKYQSLFGDGAISLTMDTTYLNAVAGGPYNVTLPDGNYRREIKIILIPGGNLANTSTFNVTGSFAGFDHLSFDSIGFNAVLFWDGTKWHLIGGNANVA